MSLSFYIGEIVSCDVVEKVDFDTGKSDTCLSVNLVLEITSDGKPKILSEDILLPVEYQEAIEQNIGRLVAIPTGLVLADKSFPFYMEN